MQIVPIRDLKDTVKIETLCTEENGPVFVTKNGYGRLVVMDIEYYERTMKQLYEAAAIQKGLEDVENGRVRPADEALEELRLKYGLNI